MSYQTNLIELSDHLSSVTNNKFVNDEISLARKKFESSDDPSVQLYGLSQAGKSTFLSCLTQGEQFIPIGTGTATTAVVIELISDNSNTHSRAEVKWLSPEELQELAEHPLKYFLQDYNAFKSNGGKRSSTSGRKGARVIDHPQEPDESLLSSPKYRAHLGKILAAAKRARRAERTKTIGEDNDLAITEIILRHYESYEREYRRGFQPIRQLAELPEWTRQPVHWGKWEEKSLADYKFDEVKSFFTKTVRLYAAVNSIAKGLTVLDTPGFGISNIHDRICRSAQIRAEAVFLVVSQQIGQDQMREMQQLSAGLKDNLFVIWNSKDGTKRNARELVDIALVKLRNEAGIVVPKERTAVANLHLALRAMQWNSLSNGGKLKDQTENSLKERFSRIYDFDPSKHRIETGIKNELLAAVGEFADAFERDEANENPINDGLNQSGWPEVVKLLGKAKEIPYKQKQLRFALSLVNASIRYLEGFPTAKEIRELNQAIDALNTIAHKLVNSIIKKNRDQMVGEWESESTRVFDEFLDYIADRQELKNLKSNLRDKIKNATYYSTVPPKVVAGIDDYVRARTAVWLQKIVGFQTIESRDRILSPYNMATFEIAQWLKTEWAKQSELNDSLELPAASPPILKIDDLRLEFIAWNKVIAETIFSPTWVERSVKFVWETGVGVFNEAKKTLSSLWGKTKNWWYEKDEKVKPPKETPSFNKDKAMREMEEKVDGYFSKRTIRDLYELGKDPSAFDEALTNREGSSYESVFDFIVEYLEVKDINFSRERCTTLYSVWENASEQIKQALNAALDSWVSSIEPIIQERVRNLSSKSPEAVSLATLTEIEQLFDSGEFEEFQNETFNSARNQLNRVINARKLDSKKI